jgi:hypothetical protein
MRTYPIVILLILGFIVTGSSQEKYLCRNGHIWIYSHTPLEDIEAHNNEAASVLNASAGDLAFQVLIKSFKFRRALMEEHFNENFMQSSRYPKSDFKGKITNLDSINLSKPGIYAATAEGSLTIHNKTNKIRQNGTIEVKDGKLYLKAKFNVIPQDYDIEIPSTVRDKIGKNMEVNVDMVYEPYQK